MLAVGLVFGFANAQKIQYGVKAGLSAETLIGNLAGLGNFNSKLGYTLGGFAEYKFAEKFSLQPEVLYSKLGAKSDDVININRKDYVIKGDLDLFYINIPIMIKYYIIDKISLEFGPQIGFLSDVNSDGTINGTAYEVGKENFEKVDVGIDIGAGYCFTKHVSAGARYNYGVTNIQKLSNSKLINSVASLTLGYTF